MAFKWRKWLSKTVIEEAGGSQLILPALDALARKMKFYINVEWTPVNPKKTKHERIYALQPLLAQDRLYIVNTLPTTTTWFVSSCAFQDKGMMISGRGINAAPLA